MGRVALAFAVAVFALPVMILLSGTPDAWAGARRIGGVTAAGALGLGIPAFLYFASFEFRVGNGAGRW